MASGTRSAHFGNILVLASKNGASTIEGYLVELDANTGTVLNAWDLAKVFDPKRMTYIDAEKWDIGQNGDWLHGNGLAYAAADESIIISGRHQGVAKIRRDGTLVWLLAPHKGWKDPWTQKLLTAVNGPLAPYADAVQLGTQAVGTASTPEFDWPYGQHSPVLLRAGGCRQRRSAIVLAGADAHRTAATARQARTLLAGGGDGIAPVRFPT